MGLLSFLKTANVAEVVEEQKRSGGKSKQWNPNPALLAIRVWKDGSVFPSQALVAKFNLDYQDGTPVITPAVGKEGDLEYKPATSKTALKENPGFGFDVIDSRDWAGYKAEGNMLFISPIERGNPKIDLFASTVYDKDGKAKSNVMDQGANTFGKAVLIPAIEEVYGILFEDALTEDGVEFVDMVVASELEGIDIVKQFSKPITLVPKKISRGADKGKSDYERRENASIYGFVPLSLTDQAVEPEGNDMSEEINEEDGDLLETDEVTVEELTA